MAVGDLDANWVRKIRRGRDALEGKLLCARCEEMTIMKIDALAIRFEATG
jgi:hypothetical protein